MTSILPQIQELDQIPALHERYAEGLLSLMQNRLLTQDEVDIGTFQIGKGYGSGIAFDSDDMEHARLELRFYANKQRFVLVVTDDGEDLNTSSFRYRITEDSDLYGMIPEKLNQLMREVASEQVGMVYTPG